MPKHYKKPKGVDAHQHRAGEDWSKAEAWVQEMIAQERLLVDPVAIAFPGLPLTPVADTDWIILGEVGELVALTDAEFQSQYGNSLLADAPSSSSRARRW